SPPKIIVPPPKPPVIAPAEPALSIQLSADFENGKVWLDGQLAGELNSSQFTLANLTPAQHTIRIGEGRSQLEFKTSGAQSKAPTIEGISAKEIGAVFVSNAGNRFSIYASFPPKPPPA